MKTVSGSLKHSGGLRTERAVYPFTAIVGQGEMKLGLLLNVIDPLIGGVLIMGHRGTAKSTAVRALADLLPQVWRVRGCAYGCDPSDVENLCDECADAVERGEKLQRERARVSVIDLPLGATEDRVCGTLNIERALTGGVKAFEPGLLARANRGFLYIDEVNLLEDHLVDLLLDTSATGRNVVERESISVEHPSRFVLVGSGNPEEGELRPQLLDRFGLHVEIRTSEDLEERLTIVERRAGFERDPKAFRLSWETEQESLRRRIVRAQKLVRTVKIDRDTLRKVAELCLLLKIDGHRGELTIARAASALAALEGRRAVTETDVERVAVMSLRHRLRRDPLDQTPGGARIEQALDELFPKGEAKASSKAKSRESSYDEPDDFHNGNKRPRGDNRSGNGNGQGGRELEQSAPLEPGQKFSEPELKQPEANHTRRHPASSRSARRQGNRSQSVYNTLRGRYARATALKSPGARLAIDATLRAMMSAGTTFSLPTPNLYPLTPALRYKLYKRKTGTLFIFAVDASGSMAINRIRQAKGALALLLERSYVRRDHVALVSFRGEGAEVLLPSCRSASRARKILDEILVGGATPLAAGIDASLHLASRALRRGAQRVVLFLFTDGRANVQLKSGTLLDKRVRQQAIGRELELLGAALKCAPVSVVVVDTQSGYTSSGEGRVLAETLGGHYIFLPANGKVKEIDSLSQAL